MVTYQFQMAIDILTQKFFKGGSSFLTVELYILAQRPCELK